MGSNTSKAYGAVGRDDLLIFDDDAVTIVTDKKHVLYDDRINIPLDEALVRNIMSRGVVDPITVRKNGEVDGKPIVEVVDGRQRVRAVREANRRLEEQGKEKIRIPAQRKRGDDTDMYGIMVGSFIRQDDRPLSRARKVCKYLAMGRSEEEATVAFGLNIQTIRAYVQLLDCATEVQSAVEKGEVSVQVALKLSKLPREIQVSMLEELKTEGATHGAKGVRAAEEKIGKPPAPKVRSRKHIQAMIHLLNNTDEALPDARKVLRYVLGEDGVLGQKWIPKAKPKAEKKEKAPKKVKGAPVLETDVDPEDDLGETEESGQEDDDEAPVLDSEFDGGEDLTPEDLVI